MAKCSHMSEARPVKAKSAGCEECIASGHTWVEARMCLVCGHVGCCDSSPGRHATRHFQETGHPVMKSIEPGANWSWCYIDKTYL